MQKFMEVVPPDTSLERFQAVLGSGLVADIFHADAQIANRLAVRRALGLGALPSTPGSHIVDYSMYLDEMIVAGNYDWKNSDITAERFPIVGKGRMRVEVLMQGTSPIANYLQIRTAGAVAKSTGPIAVLSGDTVNGKRFNGSGYLTSYVIDDPLDGPVKATIEFVGNGALVGAVS